MAEQHVDERAKGALRGRAAARPELAALVGELLGVLLSIPPLQRPEVLPYVILAR